MNVQSFKTLVLREHWENKSIVRAPLIIAAVVLFSVIVGMFTAQHMVMSLDNEMTHEIHLGFEELSQKDEAELSIVMKGVSLGMYLAPLAVGFVFVLFFYVLGSLYNERKDRSILFWKSMPVSDTQTVLSKVFTAFVSAPVITASVAVISQVIGLILLTIMVWVNGGSAWDLIWKHASLFSVFFNDFALLIVLGLWMAPILGWLWFVSAYANRGAFLIALFVPLGIMLVEGMIFHSAKFAELIGSHFEKIEIIVTGAVERGHPFEIMTSGGFWIGLIICTAFVSVSIYIRRFRDDSY